MSNLIMAVEEHGQVVQRELLEEVNNVLLRLVWERLVGRYSELQVTHYKLDAQSSGVGRLSILLSLQTTCYFIIANGQGT
jgi:hypothetical protein